MKILYNFTIYFRYPKLFGACDLFGGSTTAVGPRWETAVTIMASTAKEAMELLEEGYRHMEIVKVDYHIIPIKHNVLKVIQLNEKIELINEFESISEASRMTNIKRTSIINCLKGRSKTSGGFIWKYKNK